MQRSLKSEVTFNFTNASVALIDASPICLEVLTGILSGCGFRKMFRCSNLRMGSDVIKTHSLDLILIDPAPFADDAYNLISWLRADQRALNSDACVIIMTSYTRVRSISQARQCGADYVVTKPFSTTSLLERIIWVAEKGRKHGELLAPPELVSSSGSGVEMW